MNTKCNCGSLNNQQISPYEEKKLTDIRNAFQPLRAQKKEKVNYLMVFLLILLAYVVMKRLYC